MLEINDIEYEKEKKIWNSTAPGKLMRLILFSNGSLLRLLVMFGI